MSSYGILQMKDSGGLPVSFRIHPSQSDSSSVFPAKNVLTFLLESQEDFRMESSITDRFISERVLHKLKDTLQAQSGLLGSDLSIQMSCMQAATSTLLEVKNILNDLSKKSLRNVADNLASTDGHLVFQRYLIKSYYFMQSNGKTTDLLQEGSRPSAVLIFCPLYVAVTEVLTPLLVSENLLVILPPRRYFSYFLKI